MPVNPPDDKKVFRQMPNCIENNRWSLKIEFFKSWPACQNREKTFSRPSSIPE